MANHKDLVKEISEELEVSKKEVEAFIDVYTKKLHEKLAQGEEVVIKNIAKIKTKVRPAREGRNPSTGESIHIEEKTVPVVTPVKALKDTIAIGESVIASK